MAAVLVSVYRYGRRNVADPWSGPSRKVWLLSKVLQRVMLFIVEGADMLAWTVQQGEGVKQVNRKGNVQKRLIK